MRTIKAFLPLMMLTMAGVAQGQLAQEPLLNRPGRVPPNVALLLDNSASMMRDYIYEYGDVDGSGPQGPYRGSAGTAMPFGRSPQLNKIAYDPRVRYRPRIDYLGQPVPFPTDSWFVLPTQWEVWFSKWVGSYVTPQNELHDAVLYPQHWHVPGYVPLASEVVAGSTAAYPNRVNLATLPANSTFPKFVGRTDCVTLPTACTVAEERSNYHQYFAWYVSRRKMVQTAIGLAAMEIPADSIRLGWGTFSDLTASPSFGRPVPTMGRGVSSYTEGPSGTKRRFFDWLYGVTFDQNTPNLAAYYNLGRYFERTDSDGPWATTPNPDSVRLTTEPAPSGPGATELPSNHASCRRSFAMLITDGYWNDPVGASNPRPVVGNVDNTPFSIPRDVGPPFVYTPRAPYRDVASDTLADIAMHYWGRDLRPDLRNQVSPMGSGSMQNPSTWQNLSFYAVTLGVKGSLPTDTPTVAGLNTGDISWPSPAANQITTIDDTWHATINGRGEHISAKNAEDVNSAFKRMMIGIAGSPQTLSGVAVSSTYLRDGTRKYKPEYIPGQWSGNLSAIELDAATGHEKQPPIIHWQVEQGVDVTGDPISTIPAAALRNVTTWTGSAGANFDAAATGLAPDLVAYVRGDPAKELRKPSGVFRTRSAKLGDIVNSNPLFVKDGVDLGYQRLGPGFGDYRAFVAAKAARPGMLYVGANDGMLHAFRDSDGGEAFAFVPKALWPELHRLTQVPMSHRYYVDGPNVETDAFLGGTWRNLLLGTTGAGAKAVFAVDVTNPLNMGPNNVAWEVNAAMSGFSRLGHVLSDVTAGITQDGQWVAIFGNGFGSTDGTAALFIVDLRTGGLVQELTTPVSGGNGLGGVRLVLNENQRIVGAYAGDLKGNLWKFDLSGSPSQWRVGLGSAPLFAAGPTEPITAAPAVLPHADRGYVVAFGTGKFHEMGDTVAPFITQRLYGVWDAQPFGSSSTPGGAAISGRSQLVEQVVTTVVTGTPPTPFPQISANPVNWGDGLTGVRGWFMNLPNNGQRMTYPMQRLPGTFVMATTLSPVSAAAPDVCQVAGAGSGWVYIFDAVTGSGPTRRAIDTNGDGNIDTADMVVSGFQDPVDGRPTPIELQSTSLTSRLCVETAQQQCTRVDIACGQLGAPACPGATAEGIRSRVWRQLFMR